MDADAAPGGTVVVAQLTVPTDSSFTAKLSAQGHTKSAMIHTYWYHGCVNVARTHLMESNRSTAGWSYHSAHLDGRGHRLHPVIGLDTSRAAHTKPIVTVSMHIRPY
jgi:hypothetical protein